MAEQLERFKDLLYQIDSDGHNKKVAEKNDMIVRAYQLFEDEGLRAVLAENDAQYPEILKHLSNIVCSECEENKKRHVDNKKKNTLRFGAFELYAVFLKFHCNVLSQAVQFDDIITGLLTCFESFYIIREATPGATSAWMQTIDLLNDVFSAYPPIDLEYAKLKSVWNTCFKYLQIAITNTSKTERVKLLNVIAQITPSIHETFFFTTIKTVIDNIDNLVKAFRWDRKDPARMVLLNSVNALIEKNSERYRDYLLEKFSPLAANLVETIAIVGPNDARLTSPQKGVRFHDNVLETDYHSSLYRFIENILILSYPDCEINSLSYASSDIVELCSQHFVFELDEKSKKAHSAGRKFIVCRNRLPLLGRVLLLMHMYNLKNSSGYHSVAKRAKKTSILSQFVQEGTYCHFQVILELVTTWRHRLTSEDLDELASELVKFTPKMLKKDDKLEIFMRIVGKLFLEKRNIEASSYDDLWNWAISLLQMPAIQEAACLAISGIINYYDEVLTAKSDDIFKVLIFQIAQFGVYRKPVLDLIHLVLTKFEFDERLNFRVDLQTGCNEWVFRSQLISAVLNFSLPTENVQSLIMGILTYHPHEIQYVMDLPERPSNDFEARLAEVYCKSFKKLSEKHPQTFGAQNTIPLLIQRVIEELDRIWEKNEEFCEKRLFLWKIACFIKRTFHLPNSHGQLEFFEQDISRHIVNPPYRCLIEKMDIGNLWEETTPHLRQVIIQISEETGSPICQRYQFFWGEPVALSKELLDAEAIRNSQFIDDLILRNVADLSFNDLVLIIRKFSHKLKPKTNETLIKQLIHEIQQETQLGSPESIECLNQRFVFTVCKFINLRDIPSSEDLKQYLFFSADIAAEVVSQIPLSYFTNNHLEELVPKLSSLQFYHLFLAGLENMKNEYIPLPILKGLLLHSFGYLAEFVPNFEKFVSFWKPLLAFLKINMDNVNPEWETIIPQNDVLFQRLCGKSTAVDHHYSPAIFTFPTKVIEMLYQDPAFSGNWFHWDDPASFYRTLRNLRCYIYKLRQSSPPALNYPLICLQSMITFLKNGADVSNHADDVVSIITSLFHDAVKFCSDLALSELVLDFVNTIDIAKLSALRALVVVDIIFDNYPSFPQSILNLRNLCKNGHNGSCLEWFMGYIEYKEALQFPERSDRAEVPMFLSTEVTELVSNKFAPDLPGYHFQLFGFWEALYKRLESQPDINVLHCVIPFWMFYPRLRKCLTKILVLFPSTQIDSILRDYRFFMSALSNHSEFSTFIPEFVLVIAFDPTVIYEESITKTIYDVLCASIMQKSQPLSQFIECDVDEEISPWNYAGIILRNLKPFIPKKAWLLKFLSVSYKLPLCANLSLIRFLKLSNEEGRLHLIQLLNSTFSTLLMEDNEQIKSRHSSTTFSGTILPFVVSQRNTAPSEISSSSSTSSVFESENSVMFLFSAINLIENLYDQISYFDLKLLIQCLIRAKMFKEAHYLLKYHIDHMPNDARAHFAFRKSLSFIDAIEDEELKYFLVEILIGLKDYIALSQLPLYLRTKSNVRALIAECKHDWGAMASVSNTVDEKDTHARALLSLGSLPSGCSKEVKYEAVVQLSSWNDHENAVSFPKTALSHWEQLYSVIKRHKDGKMMNHLEFLDNGIEAISSKTIIDPVLLKHCRHLLLLQYLIQNRSCFIPDGVLRCSFHLANISRPNSVNNEESIERAVLAVVNQSETLRKNGAILLSLKLLDSFESITNQASRTLRTNDVTQSFAMEIELERAKTFIANNDPDMAAFLLTELTKRISDEIVADKVANNVSRAYKLLSKLQPEECLNHLSKAAKIAARTDLYSKNLVKLAMFSENEYQTMQEYMEGSAFKQKQEFVNECSASTPKQTVRRQRNRDDNLKDHVLKKELQIEEFSIISMKQRKLQSLILCVENYIKAIINGSTDKTIVYRIVALMIQNTDEKEVMALIQDNVAKIPPNVWLPVLNLLLPHLFSDKLAIAEVVEKISLISIKSFPYVATRHFLFYLNDSSTNKYGTYQRDKKVLKLFEKCGSKTSKVDKILKNLIKADKCFIEIGASQFTNTSFYAFHGKGRYELTSELKLMKHLDFFKNIPIPTMCQPVFPPGDPRNFDINQFITIKGVDKIVAEAGGLSKPKIFKFIGSNDKTYKLIFKGEDLRQDSLIQQLFSIQNLLMEQNPACGSSFSPLRTYAVIPLSPDCGIIEWCEGTISLCEYLVGMDKSSGAHKEYRPDDITANAAQLTMKNGNIGADGTQKFLDICKKIQPVFRHFFYSKFTNSQEFHQAIERYTQSLAQWSIVCYIVGLGDRHLNNILVDEKRAELVHIDLGQVFEFSKRTLPIPEKVPFRLTRDMVDPLIIDGVYGRLKDIAVHTMKQMHQNCHVIVGIASSLIHDPVSTFLAGADETNKRYFVAEGAILRLKEKLAGQDSTIFAMTPEKQVCKLFEDAMNPENLSQVFVGWMPFI